MINGRARLGPRSVSLVPARDIREIRDRAEARRLIEAAAEQHGRHFARELLAGMGPSAPDDDDAALEILVQQLVDGTLVLVRQESSPRRLDAPRSTWLSELVGPGGEEPQRFEPARDETTWFEVRVVDELGQPLEGVGLSLFVDGTDHRITTDSEGVARVEGATLSNATVKIDDLAALRELVRPRWEQVREGDWLASEPEHTYLGARAPLPVVRIRSKTPHTLVVQPRVILARIKGMLFDTSKSFLLPNALAHLPRLTSLYANNPHSTLLLVGHTDTTGDPEGNDPLSLERAEMVAAFLRDDPDPWLVWYGSSKPSAKRWGAREDGLMLQAVLARTGEAVEGSALVHFQRTRGLTVDGIAGPQTRRALITEYMQADGTTLPPSVELVLHGCGESFPLDAAGESLEVRAADGESDAVDRRVELLFFERALGILPAPPGPVSGPDDPEYPEWRRRAVETLELDVDAEVTSIVIDDPLFGVAATLTVEVTYEDRDPVQVSTDAEGRLPIDPSQGPIADLRYSWHGGEYQRRVFTAIDDVASPDGAWQRLVHLGYVRTPQPERTAPDESALGDALMSFQLDYGLEPTGEHDEATVTMLLRAHDQDLRPWRDRDWELPEDPEPDVEKPKQEVA